MSHLYFVRMTVTMFIYFFCKGMQFSVSLLFILENNGGRAHMVSLLLGKFWAFLALIFDLKFYVALPWVRLHGGNYRIWIYSI